MRLDDPWWVLKATVPEQVILLLYLDILSTTGLQLPEMIDLTAAAIFMDMITSFVID